MPKPTTALHVFQYQGIDSTGRGVQGEMEAATLLLAKLLLQQQGITTSRITKKPLPWFSYFSQKITHRELAGFSRQLATLLAAGIALSQALDILATGQHKLTLKGLLKALQQDIAHGSTFAQAMRKHPAHFKPLHCSLVHIGEQTGRLDTMLEAVADYQEKMEAIKNKAKKIMTYPAALVCIAFTITFALLLLVVPQFASLFKEFGAPLPASTNCLLLMSQGLLATWYWLASALGIGVYAFIVRKKRNKAFALKIDKLLLRIPTLGLIIRKVCIARFASTLALTFAAGLPVVEALQSVAAAMGNLPYANAVDAIKTQIASGEPIHTAMQNTQQFPHMVVHMVAVGEESGTLEKMLTKVAVLYEEEVDHALETMSNLLEPVIMSFLGLIIGGLVVCMYLPLFTLGAVM